MLRSWTWTGLVASASCPHCGRVIRARARTALGKGLAVHRLKGAWLMHVRTHEHAQSRPPWDAPERRPEPALDSFAPPWRTP
jgi:hypothetical protein